MQVSLTTQGVQGFCGLRVFSCVGSKIVALETRVAYSGAQAGELSSDREKTPRGRAMAHACMHGMISNLSLHSCILTGKTRLLAT